MTRVWKQKIVNALSNGEQHLDCLNVLRLHLVDGAEESAIREGIHHGLARNLHVEDRCNA